MKCNYIIAIILMIVGVLFVSGGYAGFTVSELCPCATTSEPCYCGTHENPAAREIIYVGISITMSGVILFVITTFKK